MEDSLEKKNEKKWCIGSLSPSHVKALKDEVKFPFLFAVIYVVLNLVFSDFMNNMWIKQFGIGIVGFTGLLFVQEQYQRVTKKVNDAEAFENLQGEVGGINNQFEKLNEDLQEVMAHLRANRSVPGTRGIAVGNLPTEETSGPRAIITPPIVSFMQQANIALQKNLTLPAMLVSAVGFEQSVLQAAIRVGVKDNKMGSMQLLKQLQNLISQADFERLRSVVALRNGLFHARPDQLNMSGEDAKLAIEEFDWAVHQLDQLIPKSN